MKSHYINISVLFFLFALLLSTHISCANNDNSTSLFKKGVSEYENGNFHEAIIHFQKIIDNDYANFETHYNLANTYYKINKFPEAIYHYEKALQYEPKNEDALYNISLVQTQININQQAIPEHFIIRLLDSSMKLFSLKNWGIMLIVLIILSLSSFLVFLLTEPANVKKILLFASIILTIFTISSLFLANRMYKTMQTPSHAIIMTTSAGVKSAPDISSADIHVVRAGEKVKILSSSNNWYEIRVSDGNKGWVQKSSLKEL